MHYLERLIHRALAVPRDQVPGVFDPFEEVAPWEPEASTSRAPVTAVQPDGSDEPVEERPGRSPRLAFADPLRTVQEPAATVPFAPPTPQALAASPIPSPRADVPEQLAPEAVLDPHAPSAQASLARADAFMRSLGIQHPAMDSPASAYAKAQAPTAPEPAIPAVPPQPLVEAQHQEPALLRPSLPRHAVADMPPTPAPRSGATLAGPAREASAPSPRRSAHAAPAERIVQTTLVLAPPSRRLDDLAHSSRIARFGLGQT